MFRPGEKRLVERVYKGGVLNFRAQELHTLTITHWLLMLMGFTSSTAQSPGITLITLLPPVPLHFPLLL